MRIAGSIALGCAALSCGGGQQGDDGTGVATASASVSGSAGESTGTTATSVSTATGDTGSAATSGSSVDDTADDAPKLDIVVPDLGDRPPPEMPTCDTLEDFGPTSVGCEFWGVDVPVSAGFTSGGLGIGVGNPWELDVTVTFEDMRGPNDTLREIGQVVLGPQESTIVAVNGPGGLLADQDHTVVTGLNAVAAFRVTSDQPITAMQINPVGGAASFVPDASMLLPTNALDASHFALGYGGTFAGFVIAVATQDGTTVTTQSGDVMLDAFDAFVWDPLDGTGFFVGADAPIAVFSGTSCTNVPVGTAWCDHIEEQVIPLSAWGTTYVGARHPQRMAARNPAPENVVWKLVAASDDTTVTLTPAVAGAQVQLALAGESFEFATAESFLAESAPDKPFMLVQYMAGGTSVGNCAGPADGIPVGDPYMMQMVPVEQWLTQLPFLTDTSYIRDFVFIARNSGSVVDLACFGPIPADRFVPIAGTGYEVGWIDLDAPMGGEANCVDGQQFIVADAPVGVHVGGIDCAASYGYPGGLSLDALWVPPTDPPG